MQKRSQPRAAPSVKQMRASGMTDEEIAEIVDMDMECNKNADDRDRELAELSEITYYERQAH